MNNISQFVLDHLFFMHTTKTGEVIYWRECVLKNDMVYGDQGYLWIFSDGEHFHSYHTPEKI